MSTNYIPGGGHPTPPFNSAILIAFAAALSLDMTAAPVKQINVSGALTLTTAGLSAGQNVELILVGDGSNRTLTLPAWKYVGVTKPTYLPANKTMRINLIVNGTTDAEVIAIVTLEPTPMATLSYAATTDIDMEGSPFQKLALTGNITFTTSNKAAGKIVRLLLSSDGSSRNLTFPVGWTFLIAAPTALAANKSALMVIHCTSTADAGVFVTYQVQP